MLLVGAGGHAREIYDVLLDNSRNCSISISLFEDIVTGNEVKWGTGITMLRSYEEAATLLKSNPEFILSVGKPKLRQEFFTNLVRIGGSPYSIISNRAFISNNAVSLGEGINIMAFAFVSCNVVLGNGVLVNTGARIHHDCNIGAFTEISPNATITGNCQIGELCSIGASATVLPNIKIGNNVVIGAGCVVTKNVKDGAKLVGVPGRPIIN